MSNCVSSYVINMFHEEDCGQCLPPCLSSTPEIAFIQYQNQPSTDQSLSFVANRANTLEITNQEVADYTPSQLVGDIGGAGGLFLGVSFGTLVGVCDCAVLAFISFCRRLTRRRHSLTSYDQVVMDYGYDQPAKPWI